MKKAIQRRTAVSIFIVGILPIIVGTSFVYIQGRKELTESVGKDFARIAREIAGNIEIIIEQSVSSIRGLAISPVLRNAVRSANKAYAGKDEASIEKEIQQLDIQWVRTGNKGESLKKFLLNPAAMYLLDIKKQTGEFAEIFITDSRGVLVASTGKTKYLYFGDEEWWQAAYNSGRGNIYISEIYLDPDRNQYLQSISAPIMDEEGNKLTGIIHALSKIERISHGVQKFRVGETGHAMLINSDGTILLCPIFPPNIHTVTDTLLKDITTAPRGWVIVKDNAHGGVDAIAGFAPVSAISQISEKAFGGNKWYIFVSQSPEESYASIRTLLKRILLLLVFSVGILSAMGFWAARRIVKPIHILQHGARIIGSGNLSHRIDIKTDDEIEELAREFNHMVEKINQSYTELEKRVAERTEDLKRSYKEMEDVSRLKSEFLTNMSHELRTPLNSIMGFSEMLYEGLCGELTERQKEYAEYIHKSGRHLLALINDILDLSKIEAGKMEIKPAEFSVPAAIKETQAIINPMAIKKKISIEVNIAENISTIVADKRRFEQIMYNLLSNAVKFTREGGYIKVNAMSNNYYLQIAVIDNGIGIKSEDMDLIFKEFQQADNSLSRKQEGTGLGLALTKRYVEMQGGSISMESEYGKGSNFTFRLPVNITGTGTATHSESLPDKFLP